MANRFINLDKHKDFIDESLNVLFYNHDIYNSEFISELKEFIFQGIPTEECNSVEYVQPKLTVKGKVCSKCGYTRNLDYVFCPKCGSKYIVEEKESNYNLSNIILDINDWII